MMHKIFILGLIGIGLFLAFQKQAAAQTTKISGNSFAPGVDTPKVTPGLTTFGYTFGNNLVGVKKYN